MPITIKIADIETPINVLKTTYEMLESFYKEERFDDMSIAKLILMKYESAIDLLDTKE